MAIDTSDRWALAAAMAAGAFFRFWRIDGDAYTIDEATEYLIASDSPQGIIEAGDGFPPLYHLVVWLVLAVVDEPLVTRIVPAVAGLATIPVVWWLARRLAGAQAGAIAAGFWAVWPLPVYFSREGRAYAIVVLVAALMLAAFVKAVDTDDRRWWLTFAGAAALSMYSHYFMVFMIGPLFALALWWARPTSSRATPRPWWPPSWAAGLLGAAGLFGVLCLPLLAVVQGDLDLQVGLQADRSRGIEAVAYAYQSMVSGFTIGPSLRDFHHVSTSTAIWRSLPAVVLGLPAVLYLLLHAWRAVDTRWSTLMVVLAGMAFPAWVISEPLDLGFHPRYVAWITIPLVVALAIGASATIHALAGRVATGALIVIALVAFANRVLVDDYRNEDARTAAQLIDAAPGVPVLSVADYMCVPVAHHSIERQCRRWPDDPGAAADSVFGLPTTTGAATLQAAVASLDNRVDVGERYLLLYSRVFDGDPDGLLLEALQERDELTLIESLIAIDVFEGERSR